MRFIPPPTAEGPGQGALPSVSTTDCVSPKLEETSMWNVGKWAGRGTGKITDKARGVVQMHSEQSWKDPKRIQVGDRGVRGSKTPRDLASLPSLFLFNLRTTMRSGGQELSFLSWEREMRAHRVGLQPTFLPSPPRQQCTFREGCEPGKELLPPYYDTGVCLGAP